MTYLKNLIVLFFIFFIAGAGLTICFFIIRNERVDNIALKMKPTVLAHGSVTSTVPKDNYELKKIHQPSLKLLFVGDMMFDRTVADRIRQSNSFDYPFTLICRTNDCIFNEWDFTVGNLEGPVTAKRLSPTKEIDFAFDPKIASVIKKVGIDAVSQANNHVLDQGLIGAKESRAAMTEAGVLVFGDQVDDGFNLSTVFLEKSGKIVSLVGFNVTDNSLDEKAAKSSVEQARTKADYVIIFVHWGQEYKAMPDAGQIKLAHKLVDWGADAVIGSHPHWMQSVEIYNDRPIVYSLGNFIFDQDWSVETNFGLMAGLILSHESKKMELIPIKILNSRPEVLTGNERQMRLKRLAEISDKKLTANIIQGTIDY